MALQRSIVHKQKRVGAAVRYYYIVFLNFPGRVQGSATSNHQWDCGIEVSKGSN